ncbi:uncharacterized protein [Amphiura filiformis]|uniref:uncharacterized protein n=1 Tax=Amphiura filiformis TaxID=82378 RepID=UPI003B223C72
MADFHKYIYRKPFSLFRFTIVNIICSLILLHNNETQARLETFPSWSTEDTNQSICAIQNLEDIYGYEAVSIKGTRDQDCSVHVKVPEGSAILFDIIDGHLKGTDYLYVEKIGNHGNLRNDSYKYTSFTGSSLPCHTVLYNSELIIDFRCNITFFVIEISAEQNFFEYREPDAMNESSKCNNMDDYDGKIQCNETNLDFNKLYVLYDDIWTAPHQSYGVNCDVNCPINCTCALSNMEVIYNCTQRVDQALQERVMLIFPKQISSLYFIGNSISSIKSSTFATIGYEVRILHVDSNKLQCANLSASMFQNLPKLQELGLTNNKLIMLNPGLLNTLTELTHLWLQHNNLSELHKETFCNLQSLQILNLCCNNLSSLHPYLFQHLVSLMELVLYRNKIAHLEPLIFNNLSFLHILDIGANQLVHLKHGLFDRLRGLSVLYLDGNKLVHLQSGLFQGLQNLSRLYLNSNNLVLLQSGIFQGLQTLSRLYLISNKLAMVDKGVFQDLVSLKMLYLNNNNLTTVYEMFINLDELSSLILNHNKISFLPAFCFENVSKIDSLDLTYNTLNSIHSDAFSHLKHLSNLSLAYNNLTVLETGVFHSLKNLSYLYLNNNSLVSISNGMFDNLYNLKRLNLAANNLTTLSYNLFKTLMKLTLLDLSFNNLNNIPYIDHISSLTLVKLRGNELKKVSNLLISNSSRNLEVYVDQPEICKCFVPTSVNCSSTKKQSQYLTCSRLLSTETLMIFMWILGSCALFGNILVLYWRNHFHKEGNKVQNILLGNLAVSDFLMGVYMIIIASADVHFGQYFPMSAELWRISHVCKLAGALSIVSSEASVLFITLISIDSDRCTFTLL